MYVGVTQELDSLVPSALLVDNFKIHSVAEPSALVLFSLRTCWCLRYEAPEKINLAAVGAGLDRL